MPHFLIIAYEALWAVLFVVAPLTCIYGLTKVPAPETARRTRGIASLGFLISVLVVFSLAVTVLQPLALVVLPSTFIFLVGVFRPSALLLKGVRIYLISCLVLGELFWTWAAWDQFDRGLW
jgi:hypothetical protein